MIDGLGCDRGLFSSRNDTIIDVMTDKLYNLVARSGSRIRLEKYFARITSNKGEVVQGESNHDQMNKPDQDG